MTRARSRAPFLPKPPQNPTPTSHAKFETQGLEFCNRDARRIRDPTPAK